jgi:hypothetical protein
MTMKFTLTELQRAITPEYVRTSRIIAFALAAGAAFFFSAVVLIYAMHSPNFDADDSFIEQMSYLLIGFALCSYTASYVVYKKSFTAETLSNPITMEDGTLKDEPVQIFLSRVRTGMIIRLAFFEGTTLLGLCVLMLAAMSGILQAKPLYWVNAIYPAIMIALVIATFPSRARIEALYQELAHS